MTNNRDKDNGEQHPHFDGAKEGIISDPAGKQIGVQTDKSKQFANPVDAHSLKKSHEPENLNKK